MEQTIPCAVCRDLMPLVKDGVASEASAALVNGHTAHCDDCRARLGEDVPAAEPDDASVIKRIRRKVSLRLLAFVVLGAALGLALRPDEHFLYNLLVMPVVGAILYLFAGRRWYVAAGVIAAVGTIWQLVNLSHMQPEPSMWLDAEIAVMAGLAYGLLCLIGGGIAALFKYAFAREEKEGHGDEKEKNQE